MNASKLSLLAVLFFSVFALGLGGCQGTTDAGETGATPDEPLDFDALMAQLLAEDVPPSGGAPSDQGDPTQGDPTEMGAVFPFLTAAQEQVFNNRVTSLRHEVYTWQGDMLSWQAIDCSSRGITNCHGFFCVIYWDARDLFLNGYETVFRELIGDFRLFLSADDWLVFHQAKLEWADYYAQSVRDRDC